jgi:acyl-CoA reductase-like NAD-dependent aldehyde dehydrogenase
MIQVVQAFDRTPITEIKSDDAAALDRKIETARRLYSERALWLKPHQRMEILRKLTVLMEGNREELGRQIAREGGKPLTHALIEADRAIDSVRSAADEMRVMAGREIPMGLSSASTDRRAFTIREPIGVVAAISAFNHPLNLIVHQVVPAIAVGCPVIVKPALTTPLSCIDFVALLHEAGLPPEWCQVFLPETDEQAERLATDPGIGLSELHLLEPSRLVPTVQAAARHALRIGTRWRSSSDHRPHRRPRPPDSTADKGRLLPCRPGLRVSSTDLCACRPRARVPRSLRRERSGIKGR